MDFYTTKAQPLVYAHLSQGLETDETRQWLGKPRLHEYYRSSDELGKLQTKSLS